MENRPSASQWDSLVTEGTPLNDAWKAGADKIAVYLKDDLLALAKGKPIALGEVGDIPTPSLFEKQPQWTWYMPWVWILLAFNDPDTIKALTNSEKILTLDEIQFSKKSGRYSIRKVASN